mgnify:CR=1 FL=1
MERYNKGVTSYLEVIENQRQEFEARLSYSENYQRLLSPQFYKALSNSAQYTFWTCAILIPFPMLLAVLLNNPKMPARNVFRASWIRDRASPPLTGLAISLMRIIILTEANSYHDRHSMP